jgi:hypothetical protein
MKHGMSEIVRSAQWKFNVRWDNHINIFLARNDMGGCLLNCSDSNTGASTGDCCIDFGVPECRVVS